MAPSGSGAVHFQAIAVLLHQRADGADGVVESPAARRGSRCDSSTFPASIFERSRTSLIRPSRCLPADRIRRRSGSRSSLAAILHHLLQHLAVADDRIQRRAQLMAHVRQEGALGAIGFFGGVFGAHQFALARASARSYPGPARHSLRARPHRSAFRPKRTAPESVGRSWCDRCAPPRCAARATSRSRITCPAGRPISSSSL